MYSLNIDNPNANDNHTWMLKHCLHFDTNQISHICGTDENVYNNKSEIASKKSVPPKIKIYEWRSIWKWPARQTDNQEPTALQFRAAIIAQS